MMAINPTRGEKADRLEPMALVGSTDVGGRCVCNLHKKARVMRRARTADGASLHGFAVSALCRLYALV